MELPACLKGCTCERETFHDCRNQFEFHRPPNKARMLNNPSLHINKLVSDPRGKSFDCRVCERVFKTEELLEKHIRNHSENRPHKCPQCPKGFKQPSHLSQHLRTHTDERPFICNVCSKAFKQSCQLKQHMRLHTGEKPYKCPECDRGFKQASQLNQHFRLHTGEKPYKCMICYKAFTQASQLRSHKKTHEPKPERKASSYKTKSHQVPNVSLSQSLPNTFQPTQVAERGLYYSSTRLGSSFSLKDLELPTDDSIHVVQLPMAHHLGLPPFST